MFSRRVVNIALSGASLLILSFLALLMVCRVIEPNFFLVFGSFSLSLVGLGLGLSLFCMGANSSSHGSSMRWSEVHARESRSIMRSNPTSAS